MSRRILGCRWEEGLRLEAGLEDEEICVESFLVELVAAEASSVRYVRLIVMLCGLMM